MDALVPIPARPLDAHKGTFGRVLVIAGSLGMSGAAVLCGSAALRGGAGLVTVATADAVRPEVAVGNPCYMTLGLPEDPAGALAALGPRLDAFDAVAVGPGLGDGPAVEAVVGRLLGHWRPVVFDADALNALARHAELSAHRAAGPRFLTPHPGEAARLLEWEPARVAAERETAARELARRWSCVALLKGHGTLVSDGERVWKNPTGNPGMATGGTGDVLAGLLAALCAVVRDPFDAARLAAHVHGRAGDLAAAALGETGLTASDVLDYLPRAAREHAAPRAD